jgi:hypothetical protein
VQSYNRYSAYLIIIDSALQQVWAFLTATKAPPIAIMHAFLMKFGLVKGVIRTNQGGELTRSNEFRAVMMNKFNYTVSPQVLTAHHRTVALRSIRAPSLSRFGRCNMALASPPNSGPRPCYILCTCITASFIQLLASPRTRAGMAGNLM